MIKKILSVLLTIALLSSLCIATFADDDGLTVLKNDYDFEDYISGTPAGWVLSSGCTVSPQIFDDEHGTTLRVENWRNDTSTGNGKYIYTKINTSSPYKAAKIQFDVYAENGNYIMIPFIYGDALGSRQDLLRVEKDGTIKINKTSGTVAIGSFAYEQWHSFELWLDFNSGYAKITFDGNVIFDGENDVLSKYGQMTSLALGNGGIPVGSDADAFYDNFKLYTCEPMSVTSISPADGANSFPRKGGVITLETSRKIYGYDDVEVYLTDAEGNKVVVLDEEENEINPVVTEYGYNTVFATVNTVLDAGAKYKINVLGNKYEITTAEENVVSSLPEITDNENGTYTATAAVSNLGENAEKATLVVASYYAADNKMFDWDYDTKTVSDDESLSKTIDVPEEEFYVKAFLVDDVNSLKLLREDYSGEAGFSFTGAGEAEFKINSVKSNGDNIEISAKADKAGERTILVKVLKRAEEIELLAAEPTVDFIAPVRTAEDGSFTLSFAPSSGNGWYDFEFAGNKVSGAEAELYFISLELQNTIRDSVNGAESVSEVSEIVGTTYRTEFSLGDEYFTENAYRTVFEQKDYEDFSSIVDVVITAYGLLEELNEKTWSNLTEFIEANKDIVIYDNEDYDYYEKLSSNKKNTINKELVGNYETFKEFRTAFSKAIDSYKAKLSASLNNKIEGSSSSSNKVQMPVTGSGGGGGASTQAPAPVTPAPAQPAFKDLGAASWAETPVTFLANKGIISGDGNGNFRPLDNVSREEFVKMIVSVFGLKSSGKAEFTDALADGWYMPYLAAAKENGIIQGKADGSFGIGEKITRQDMAVMLYRAIMASGKNVSEGEKVTFADESAFADYAIDAIAKLQAGGIISGVGNEKFAPADMANRAQAAQIIYNLFSKEVVK